MAAQAIKSDRLPIRTTEDIVLVRQHVRKAGAGTRLLTGGPDQGGHGGERDCAQHAGLRQGRVGDHRNGGAGRAGAGCARSSRIAGRASRTSIGRCRTVSRPAAGWASGSAARNGCRTSSKFSPTPGKGTRVTMTRWKTVTSRSPAT